MSILSLASAQSAYRGYEYAQEKRVLTIKQIDVGVFHATVAGSQDCSYDVTIDIAHPRKSICTCPHAAGRRIICKHMVAAYFTAFPDEEKNYIAELEDAWAEDEQWQKEQEEQANRLIQQIKKMKKRELQQVLLQVLFDGPEWQYNRFIDEYLHELIL